MARMFKVGDVVEVVTTHPASSKYGAKGDRGVVERVDYYRCRKNCGCEDGEVRVKYTHTGDAWWIHARHIALVIQDHTPADLAMALQLARLVHSDTMDCPLPSDYWKGLDVVQWLRREVERELERMA